MTSRLRAARTLGRFTAGALVIGWALASAAVHAAQSEPDLLTLPWLQIALSAVIAGWGGAAATMTRYLASVYENKPFAVKVEIAKDIVVSAVVGGMTYITGSLYQWSAMLIGLLLLLAGWAGVEILNVAADRMLAAVVK